MRAGLVVTGTLALGTVLVFTAAALTAALFPNGTVVVVRGNGSSVVFDRGFVRGGPAMPVPAPAIEVAPNVVVEGRLELQGTSTLPGDTVLSEPAR